MSEEAKTPSIKGVKGKRKRERVEIKNPKEFIGKYEMNIIKDRFIKFLYDMRVATTTQLCRMFKTEYSDRWIRMCLQNLYENQFLYRKFLSVNKKGSSDAVYFLDRIGAFYLSNEFGIKLSDLKWSIEDNGIGPEALRHTINITEIRTVLEESAAKSNVEIKKFIGERRVGRIKFTKNENELEFNPDGEIVLACDGKLYLFLLEYDTGSEIKSMIEEKIAKYEGFYSSNEFKEYYPVHPTVMFIADDILRKHRLKKWIEGCRMLKEINYLFASLDEFSKDPYKNIFDTLKTSDRANMFDV